MSHTSLIGLSTEHLTYIESDHQLHHECLSSFIQLKKAADQAGFTLAIASSFRDFKRQLFIWNNKFSGIRPLMDDNGKLINVHSLSEIEKIHAIMRWSALPGASRHHWGTDIDVYASNTLPKNTMLKLEPWEYKTGHQKQFSQWLTVNAPIYGFFFPYREDQQGVAVEPWHISHHRVSSKYMSALNPELLLKSWHSVNLSGKKTVIKNIDLLFTRYITNISKG